MADTSENQGQQQQQQGQQQQQQQQGDPWFKGADDVTMGYITSRGLDKKDAKAAALDVIKAHQEANRLLGAPHNELVRLPTKPEDEQGWANFYDKLGVPKDEKEYDFSTVKNAKGEALDADTVDYLRAQAKALHLTKAAATEMASGFVKRQASVQSKDDAENTATLATQKDALAKNWGPNFEANMFIAKQGAAKLGVTPEEVAGLEKVIGYDRIMESFRKVGVMAGEDKFVRGNNAPGGGVMTRQEAMAKKAELMSDTTWSAKYLGGDKAALREMLALNTIIQGGEVKPAA